MPFYNLIRNRLLEAGINLESSDLENSAVIEYMVFEKADCLHGIHSKPLPGAFRFIGEGNNPDIRLEPNDEPELPRSFFKFSSQLTSMASRSALHHTLIKFFDYFTSARLPIKQGLKHTKLFNFYLPNNEIEEAIQSSTLYQAAGSLEGKGLHGLLKLKKKLERYEFCFPKSNNFVQLLQNRIQEHVERFLYPKQIEQHNTVLQRELELQDAICGQERKFNESFLELGLKLSSLIENKSEEYANVARASEKLLINLSEARRAFFATNPTLLRLSVFKTHCMTHIEDAKEEFAKYRQDGAWYSELHPFFQGLIDCCRALVGIVSALTVIPAVLVEVYAPHGFLGTFFQRLKTDSLKKLESFEHNILDDEGVMRELETTLTAQFI
ncbi:hypothetical protein BN59_01266 [Legionella massiliensis]|uniref:Coiled-coil protein n=1 Tax=Legionella massiliensis TaxID=1034943 RepID=A0A078KVG9_9GAMM|nr:hypothetical protein [Legionella massiliensis]CDZ76987.1 hypothetical protein BN59_01266 [Legionella massiliensis]CEE12725.1 hypothetical protein BN1094_01266 [Legionella massiliensis]